MSKKSVKEKLAKTKATTPVVETTAEPNASTPKSTKTYRHDTTGMLFHKENYIIMGIGLVLIFVGFALMAGGKSPDPTVFAADELYSFRRITLAPILILLGFAVEGYAILKKPAAVN